MSFKQRRAPQAKRNFRISNLSRFFKRFRKPPKVEVKKAVFPTKKWPEAERYRYRACWDVLTEHLRGQLSEERKRNLLLLGIKEYAGTAKDTLSRKELESLLLELAKQEGLSLKTVEFLLDHYP
ncbi:MAG: hypothetical protein QXK06_03220 [Candidatus Diapherotrites archaeon]